MDENWYKSSAGSASYSPFQNSHPLRISSLAHRRALLVFSFDSGFLHEITQGVQINKNLQPMRVICCSNNSKHFSCRI